ncbi:MAG: MarR family transcriptional regulator [Clostridia bacterium]|nr:MarR family transcriptional regulator [Clostridia bacterium]
MDPILNALNEMLTTTYRSINKVEEVMLRHLSKDNLSLSEMHMLESIGKQGEAGATVTDIAADLDITLPSVTAMVKRLEKKGYITKEKSTEDARRVQIVLSQEGRRAEIAHRYFHRQMVRAITKDLSQQELDAIMSGLEKMNNFMRMSLYDFACGKDEE